MSPLNKLAKISWPLFLAVMAVCLLGIINLESAARSTNPDLYLTQLLWLGMGVATALFISLFDYKLTRYIAYPIYGIICLLLLVVLVTGDAHKGAQRWINLGFINLQPSELMKVAIIITMAHYLSNHWVGRKMTIRQLLRPLNMSRPIAILLLVVWKFRTPFMLDPIGELARLTHNKLTAPPVPEVMWWFKITIVLLVIALLAAWIILKILSYRHREIDSTESPVTIRNKIIVMCGLTLVIVLAILFSKNQFLQDPVAAILGGLYKSGGPGGAHELLTESYWLPILCVFLDFIYFAICLLLVRARGLQGVDDLIAPVDIIGAPALLILVEPDLGTTIIYLAIAGTMLLYSGFNRRSLAILVIAGVFGAGVAWVGILKDYQRQRITTFLDPEQDARGSGYHSIQSLIAVGSGRLMGKGHGNGTQTQLRFLPEQHTDFAFSVWAEEMGFTGCALLLFCYGLLLALLLWTAFKASDAYGSLLCVGTTAFVFWHMVINIGMVIGLLPVVGVTLPFFSYGGSSLLTLFATVGLALSASVRRRFFDGLQ